jgi:hypothetical protein
MSYYLDKGTALSGVGRCGLMRCGYHGLLQEEPPPYWSPEWPEYINKPVMNLFVTIRHYYKAWVPGGGGWRWSRDPVTGEWVKVWDFSGGGWCLTGEPQNQVYPVKGSLSWEESLSNYSAACSFSIYGYAGSIPKLLDTVEISIGTTAQVVYSGFIQNITQTTVGGTDDEGNTMYKFDLDVAGWGSLLNRKYIDKKFRDMSAGHIVQYILENFPQLHQGTICHGWYYEDDKPVEFRYTDAASAIQQLAEDSDTVFYVDERKFVHFLDYDEIMRRHAPNPLVHDWTYRADWKFPKNNYHGLSFTFDGSQYISKAIIHGSVMQPRQTGYDRESSIDVEDAPSGQLTVCYYYIEDNQREFFTEYRIFNVKEIYAMWEQEIPDPDAPWKTITIKKFHTWYAPQPKGSGSAITLGGTTIVIPPTVISDEWIPRDNEFSWKLRPEDCEDTQTNEPEFDEDGNILVQTMDEDPEEVVYDWQITYDSNVISFTGTDDTIQFVHVLITYEQKMKHDYTFTNYDVLLENQADGTDGIYEMHFEERGIETPDKAAKIAQLVFDTYSHPRIEVSYSRYSYGMDIINERIIPGTVQHLEVGGHVLDLPVESVKYSLTGWANSVPIFKIDVSLATRTRSLTHLIKSLLAG